LLYYLKRLFKKLFSPKVLDRANTIEFRINNREMEVFLNKTNVLDMKG